MPIPANYPVVGRDAFRTATGVHAAAVIKAFRKKDRELVDAVYSACRPAWSAASSRSTSARCRASRTSSSGSRRRGIPATDALVDRIFSKAKRSATVLSESEIRAEIDGG